MLRGLATVTVVIASLLGFMVATSQSNVGGDCTLIGCRSGIVVFTTKVHEQEPDAKTIRMCALGRCRSREVLDVADLPCVGVDSPRRVRFRVVLFDEDHNPLWRDSKWLRLVRNQPNGPDCPPTCFQAFAKLSPNAHEIRLAPAP